ncbi:phosphoribosylamine--glycine ligase [Paludifilum halophilum]|uniref:Phosphoribosylamine--glycine ligase n=1 Tax=Paludifilum halophilum TaxID=1642702 RepID=A0A235B6M4_9BACL|nr:phosphoribosylamine--glycine ligase [Paludifilum halophilum]OYD07537.1 phosphoribosylamine--glycine ligase [Paludifilum halophilum]
MRILVIGGGGREHALIWKLAQSPQVKSIYCAPGNGGIAEKATCVPISATDVNRLVRFAEEKAIDLTVVGPEAALLAGVVDTLEERGLKVFGPNQAAARVEGSKRYAKELMKKYGVPTGDYRVFSEGREALDYIRRRGAPIVIKADGLAAGKGVVVAETLEQAEQAVKRMLQDKAFGDAGKEIVVEERLTGQEISLMAFVDGETVVPMVPAQDHKPVFNGDKGPNTGGMGAYSPVPQIPTKIVDQAVQEILHPMARGMAEEGLHYRGVLYAGLMVTEEGPKVIEFNARFGDPETQVILPRMKSDLVEIIWAVSRGRLSETSIQWSDQSSTCVVMAAKGYPGSYKKGETITVPEPTRDRIIFHAGTARQGDALVSAGGRVLNVTSLGDDLRAAREKAYQTVDQIGFDGAHYRTDIACKGLNV